MSCPYRGTYHDPYPHCQFFLYYMLTCEMDCDWDFGCVVVSLNPLFPSFLETTSLLCLTFKSKLKEHNNDHLKTQVVYFIKSYVKILNFAQASTNAKFYKDLNGQKTKMHSL